MRNAALECLDALVGAWSVTLTNAWFLDDMSTEIHGSASFAWHRDAFVVMESELDGHPAWDLVFGHSDQGASYTALYHDERGTARVSR